MFVRQADELCPTLKHLKDRLSLYKMFLRILGFVTIVHTFWLVTLPKREAGM